MHRIESLQVLRAVAAILVVFHHSLYPLVQSHDPCWFCTQEVWRKSLVFGVDLFFVVSGFIVSTVAVRETSAVRFFLKRIWKIVPLYYAMTAIEYSAKSGYGQTPPFEQLWKSLLFFRLPAGPVLIHGWTLVYEMWFYATLAILMAFGARNLGWWGAGAMLCLGLAGWPLLILFAGGCLLGELAKRWQAPSWVGAALLSSGAGLWAFLAWQGSAYPPGFDWDNAIGNHAIRLRRFGPPALLIVAGTVLPAWRSCKMPRPLVFLGDASYPIYICQQVGLVFCAGHFTNLSGMSFALMTTLVCVAIGCAVHLAWERPFGGHWRLIYGLPLPRPALRETPGASSLPG